MKLKVVRLRGVEREGDMGMRERERERGGAKEMYNKQSTPLPLYSCGVVGAA